MLKIRLSNRTLYNLMVALLICSVWAFNETKIFTYPIKILYILLVGYYAISRGRTGSKYQAWCIVMILLSAIAMLIAPSFSSASYTFINMLQVFLIGFVTYGYLDDERKIEFALETLIWGGLLLTIRLVLVTPASVWLSWQRLGEAIGSNSNDVGNKAAISAIIALCMAKRSLGKKRITYFVAFGILFAIVLFSGSRKALIAVVAGIILLNTIGLQDKRKIIFAVLIVGVLLAIGYHFMMTNDVLYATIGRRIETMIDVLFHGGSEKHSIDLRERYIQVAWQLIKQHPISGIGLGAFPYVSGFGVYSHCDYTEVACSYGIIGAVVYYIPLLNMTFRYSVLKRKADKEYMFLIMLFVLLITYITMIMYTSAYVQFIMAIFVSHYYMLIRARENETDLEKSITKVSKQVVSARLQ